MRRVLFSFIVVSFFAATSICSALAGSAEEALTALKKLRSKCEIGISYKDYISSLADVNYEVKEYLDSNQEKRNPELAQYIAGAYGDYLVAGSLINWRVNVAYGKFGDRVDENSEMWKIFMKNYPEANYLMKNKGYSDILKRNIIEAYLPEMLSYAWLQASNKIDKANQLTKIPKKSKKK